MKITRLPLLCAVVSSFLFGFTSTHAADADNTHLRIIQTVEARFPSALLMERITSGEAWVMITVDETGKLSDALPTRYTHEAFATESLQALRQWKYEPARVDGKPVAVRVEVHLLFHASGAVISLDAASSLKALLEFADRPYYLNRMIPARELDAPPVPVRTVSPRPPRKAPGSTDSNGTAVLDFIIDEKGTPRMPVLVSTSRPELAYSAVDALGQWQFKPPTRRGVPVAVRVQQAFVFPENF